MSESRKSSIFFATISAGGCHVTTAHAMSEAIEAFYPGQFACTISDSMKEMRFAKFDNHHKNLWRWALKYPPVIRFAEHTINILPRPTIAVARRLMKKYAQAIAARLRANPPDLIVSNHGLLTTGLAMAKKWYGLETSVLTFATEPLQISAYWADPWLDHIIVSSRRVLNGLKQMGVPERNISVIGFPVRQSFLKTCPKSDGRKKLQLENKFTVLITLGGEGIGGQVDEIINDLQALAIPLQIIVITGRNPLLKNYLDTKFAAAANVHIKGFVTNMAEFITAADIVIGKAGPSSSFETMAVGRPMLVTRYAGLGEKAVLKLMIKRNIGFFTPDRKTVREKVLYYATNPKELEQVAERCRHLELGRQTEALAHAVVEYRKNQNIPASLAPPASRKMD